MEGLRYDGKGLKDRKARDEWKDTAGTRVGKGEEEGKGRG